MIELKNLGKAYRTRHGLKWVFRGLNFTAHSGQRWAFLGHNGSGKSTLVRLIGGAEDPTEGCVRTTGRVSWPLAFGGGFQGGLTGADNIAFIARIYGVDEHEAMERVQRFAELGDAMHEPVMTYSNGMRARLAFGLSLAVDFDFLLIDEIVSVGDQRFRDKCHDELHEKRRDRGFILVSHDMDYVRSHCTHAALIGASGLQVMPSVEAAIAAYSGH
jgi:capsular polysaccharide transport system ATP-binding protein